LKTTHSEKIEVGVIGISYDYFHNL
jgi:hypothetical protein